MCVFYKLIYSKDFIYMHFIYFYTFKILNIFYTSQSIVIECNGCSTCFHISSKRVVLK